MQSFPLIDLMQNCLFKKLLSASRENQKKLKESWYLSFKSNNLFCIAGFVLNRQWWFPQDSESKIFKFRIVKSKLSFEFFDVVYFQLFKIRIYL